jgi:hypothetical protein
MFVRVCRHDHILAWKNAKAPHGQYLNPGDEIFEDFISFERWIGQSQVPSGQTIRNHFLNAYFAKGGASHAANPDMSK